MLWSGFFPQALQRKHKYNWWWLVIWIFLSQSSSAFCIFNIFPAQTREFSLIHWIQVVAKVVSSYTDLDMDEGVEVPVVDYVEAYNEGYSWYDWGGYGGHRRQHRQHPPKRSAPKKPAPKGPTPRRSPFRESWMDRPNVNEFQLLWTDTALGSLPVLTSGLGETW